MLMDSATVEVEDKNPGVGNANSVDIFMVDVVGIKRRAQVFVGEDYYYYYSSTGVPNQSIRDRELNNII